MNTPSDPTTLANETMRPGDPCFNYCYWPYEPLTPGAGKLRPAALLLRAIDEMPHGSWAADTVRTIQRGIGSFRSVYGVKRIDERWALEVYVYDYERTSRVVSVERLVESCGGRLSLPTVDRNVPYFMFSFDLTESAAAADGQIGAVHVYVGNPGSDVSSGIAYEFTQHSRRLENFYFFFDAQQHQREIADKMQCSVWLESWRVPIDELLRPELKSCHTICLANKQTCDTIYFSGVNIDQFLFFLNWQHYPADFVAFVSARREQLDHLLFDVGVDYRAINGRIKFVKHGFYGVF